MTPYGLNTFIAPGAVHELRFLGYGHTEAGGYFDDHGAAAEAISEWDGRARGLYITINPVRSELLARADNRMCRRPSRLTSDEDVVYRRWLVFDVDPVRAVNGRQLTDQKVPATADEHALAGERADLIAAWLGGKGWPDPACLDSGNGAWRAYRIDLPNDRPSRDLVHTVLCAVGHHFDDETATVDRKMANAARIGRLPDTLNRKGEATLERPHRRAGGLIVPGRLDVVSVEQLEAIAALKPAPPPPPPRQAWTGPTIDSTAWLNRWLERSGLSYGSAKEWQGGWLVELRPCPWEPDHDRGAAYIGVLAGGEIFAHCHGNRCEGKGWRDLRDLVEPRRHDVRGDRRRPFLAALLGAAR